MLSKPNILKLALFATGLSGIVAEYILATLATYTIGNSVIQWTLILSTMLFAMGLGSRLSKQIDNYLLERFIVIEFLLSLFVSFSALLTYAITAYVAFNDELVIYSLRLDVVFIYSLSVIIGLLIGMEIPLVIRLNDKYESLKVNVSGIMENDYYGSLLGGLFFAFIGLPFFGLTFTPFILGTINFIVAILLYYQLRKETSFMLRKLIKGSGFFILILIVLGVVFAKPVISYGEQKRYKDKIVFTEQSKYQKIVVTRWKNDYWLYLNDNQQLSTFDEWLYHEPLVHPAMSLIPGARNVLILGGGDGCAAREVLKYPSVSTIKLIDLDEKVIRLGKEHPIFKKLNQNSLTNPKVEVLNQDAFVYLKNTDTFYDVIIIDFPDPKSIEVGRLFSFEMYKMCYKHLRPNGVVVVQSGSPYYATKAFKCIEKTMTFAGFNTIPIHNQVLTLGEWGWVIGAKSIPKERLKPILQSINFENINTRWINKEAMSLITSFGKEFIEIDSSDIEINTIHNPVLSQYYNKGNWDLY